MSSKSNPDGGIGLCTAVFLILLFLKLFGVISISWWWVFAPIIIEVILVVLFVLIFDFFGRR